MLYQEWKMPIYTYFIVIIVLLTYVFITCAGDASYQSIKALQESLLSSTTYSTTIRPVKDQSKPLTIDVSFSLVAIVSVDNVRQELLTNGFIFLFWDDEIHTWNETNYSGFNRLAPEAKQVWRPRLLLINTLDERDPFEDDHSHTFFGEDGAMGWVPGGLFSTYCALNMEKFPFDVQACQIQMCPMSYTIPSILFDADEEMNVAFYYPNPGWDLLETSVTVENISVIPGEAFSCPTFAFKLKRRSTTIVLNVILPVIFISVLNNLVFFIPGDAGEKISYAITVLLALSVFLSMVSTMTPQVSDTVPALTIYLFVLLLSSVLTVAAAILTVYLHHKDEREEASIRTKTTFQHSVNKITNIRTAVAPMTSVENPSSKHLKASTATDDNDRRPCVPRQNKYRMISRHIDKVFFVLVKGVWLIMTIWYFTFANS